MFIITLLTFYGCYHIGKNNLKYNLRSRTPSPAELKTLEKTKSSDNDDKTNSDGDYNGDDDNDDGDDGDDDDDNGDDDIVRAFNNQKKISSTPNEDLLSSFSHLLKATIDNAGIEKNEKLFNKSFEQAIHESIAMIRTLTKNDN